MNSSMALYYYITIVIVFYSLLYYLSCYDWSYGPPRPMQGAVRRLRQGAMHGEADPIIIIIIIIINIIINHYYL